MSSAISQRPKMSQAEKGALEHAKSMSPEQKRAYVEGLRGQSGYSDEVVDYILTQLKADEDAASKPQS